MSVINKLPPYLRELGNRRIKPNMVERFGKERQYALKYRGKNTGTLYNGASKGDIVMIYGDEGTRKTQLVDCIQSCLFTSDEKRTLGFVADDALKEKAILHIDTEQSEEDTYFGRHKFYSMIGEEPLEGHERYHSYNLKPYSPDQMIEQISHIIQMIEEEYDQEVGIIILDQIADMCSGGYNNSDGVIKVVKAIERWTSNTGAVTICVMHTNRQGLKANGVLGSRMDKKVALSFLVSISHQGGMTTVTPVKSRKSGEMPRFTFNQSIHDPHYPQLQDVMEAAGTAANEIDVQNGNLVPINGTVVPKVLDELDFLK